MPHSFSGFSKGIAQRLDHYVYRLINPRNGETFYVGKGQGDRVFRHIQNALFPQELDGEAGEDQATEKLQRIQAIRNGGLEVGHIIHRHGLDGPTAFEVEAALIDAYPGLSNQVAGKGSSERGAMHVQQIERIYAAQEAVFSQDEKAVLITLNRTLNDGLSVYEAVRWAWKLDPEQARGRLVIALDQGLIVEVFEVEGDWRQATIDNFPGKAADRPGRWGFTGSKASEAIRGRYVGRRVTKQKGAANPVSYKS